jgi:hypothetical protein
MGTPPPVSIQAATHELHSPTGLAAFAAAEACFATIEDWLAGGDSRGLEHAELEQQLEVRGRELLRLLFQDHVDLRALKEGRLEVADEDGACRTRVETGHDRGLATIFGEVTVSRWAYREPGRPNLHPADAVLNLPPEKHSHGLRKLAAIESSRGSFDAAVEAIERGTGQRLGKRQVEDLANRAAVDFDDFYRQRAAPVGKVTDVLVLSCDGKGVVMRPGSLRAATAKAAANGNPKLKTRLSKGEKLGRKRMAEVGAVYDTTPIPRRSSDILPGNDAERADATAGPIARNKWLTASVVDDAATVITTIFDEADRRDPQHQRTWIALVDSNVHQIQRIQAEATQRKTTVVIVVDFVHVLEYLWKAAWSFHREVLPPRRGPRRRSVGPQARPDHPGWSPDQSGRRPQKSRRPPGQQDPRERRQVRQLPDVQEAIPGLPDRTEGRLPDRDRHHRRRLPAPRERPDGPHRSPLGTTRRRSRPQATSPPQQRRLPDVLDMAPHPGTTPSPSIPLPRRRPTPRCLTSLQKSRTQLHLMHHST